MFPTGYFERMKYKSGPANCIRFNYTGNSGIAEIFMSSLSIAATATTNINLMAHTEFGTSTSQRQFNFHGVVMGDNSTSNAMRAAFDCGARWSSSTMNQTSSLILHQYGFGATVTVNFVTDTTYITLGVYNPSAANCLYAVLYGTLIMQPL